MVAVIVPSHKPTRPEPGRLCSEQIGQAAQLPSCLTHVSEGTTEPGADPAGLLEGEDPTAKPRSLCTDPEPHGTGVICEASVRGACGQKSKTLKSGQVGTPGLPSLPMGLGDSGFP